MGNSPFANAGSPKTSGERPWGGGEGWGRGGGGLGDGTRGLKEAVCPSPVPEARLPASSCHRQRPGGGLPITGPISLRLAPIEKAVSFLT